MWSGPRNISTALMRSWGNRPDTMVVDEPFYALYLKRTGKAHPGAAETVSLGETDETRIIQQLLRPLPPDKTVFYQKHMTHHLLPGCNRAWMDDVINCFLIRDPAEVISSYLRKREDPTLEDLGFIQQAELFESVRHRTGKIPAVIDAADVLRNPPQSLARLCEAIGVNFDESMLSWPPGLRDTDGIWARYWYAEVASSTGFQRYKRKKESVPVRFHEIEAEARKHYERLFEYRLH